IVRPAGAVLTDEVLAKRLPRGLGEDCPGNRHVTLTAIRRVAPPGGTSIAEMDPKVTAPPSPVTEAPGARNRPRVCWSPLAKARKNPGSWRVSAATATESLAGLDTDGGVARCGHGSSAGSADTTSPLRAQ